MNSQQILKNLKQKVNLVKCLSNDDADQQFYNLMIKAKDFFGESHPNMGFFYFEYANYILNRIQKTIDIFNQDNLHQKPKQQIVQSINQNQEQSNDNENNSIKSEKPYERKNCQKQENYESLIKQRLEKENILENSKQIENEDDDEREICQCNLQFALKIYEQERQKIKQNKESIFTNEEITGNIIKIKTRLADLSVINEQYSNAIKKYKDVIEQSTRQNYHPNRVLAEVHYLIGNAFLYQNQQECEKKAIKEFLQSIRIILSHMSKIMKYQCKFEIPTQEHIKVDRLPYIPNQKDSQEIIELKDVISCLLDKIQDTSNQIQIKQQQKQRIKAKDKFKEVITNLGVFGNRKRAPNIEENKQNQKDKKQS